MNPATKQEVDHFVAQPYRQARPISNGGKVLADLVEALVGAVFIDAECSLETAWQVVHRLIEPQFGKCASTAPCQLPPTDLFIFPFTDHFLEHHR